MDKAKDEAEAKEKARAEAFDGDFQKAKVAAKAIATMAEAMVAWAERGSESKVATYAAANGMTERIAQQRIAINNDQQRLLKRKALEMAKVAGRDTAPTLQVSRRLVQRPHLHRHR